MIQEITLKPVGENKMTTLFSGKYFDKEKSQNITIANVGGTRYVVVVDRQLTETERLFKVWFNESQRDITLRWDDELDKKTGVAIEAIQRHPQVETKGWDNPNRLGTPLFEFIDARKESTQKVRALKEKAVVFNMTNNMSISELMDISFFVGHNPVNKSFDETFVTLLDFESGILMKNPAKFLNDWKSSDRDHVVVVRKAIDLKIIALRDGKYYVGTEIVGDSADGAIAYMKINDNLFDFVKRELSEKDTLPLDHNRGNVKVSNATAEPKEAKEKVVKTLGDKADAKTERAKDSNEEHDERAILKAKMKAFGMKGWQMMDQWSLEICREKVLAEEGKRKQPAFA